MKITLSQRWDRVVKDAKRTGTLGPAAGNVSRNPSLDYYQTRFIHDMAQVRTALDHGNSLLAVKALGSIIRLSESALTDNDLGVDDLISIGDVSDNASHLLDTIREDRHVDRVGLDTLDRTMPYDPWVERINKVRNNNPYPVVGLADWKVIKRQHPGVIVRSKVGPKGMVRLAIWGRGTKKHVIPISWHPIKNPPIKMYRAALARKRRNLLAETPGSARHARLLDEIESLLRQAAEDQDVTAQEAHDLSGSGDVPPNAGILEWLGGGADATTTSDIDEYINQFRKDYYQQYGYDKEGLAALEQAIRRGETLDQDWFTWMTGMKGKKKRKKNPSLNDRDRKIISTVWERPYAFGTGAEIDRADSLVDAGMLTRVKIMDLPQWFYAPTAHGRSLFLMDTAIEMDHPIVPSLNNPDRAYWEDALDAVWRDEIEQGETLPIDIHDGPEEEDRYRRKIRLILHDADLDQELTDEDKMNLRTEYVDNDHYLIGNPHVLDYPYNLVRASHAERMISTIVGGVVSLFALWAWGKRA